MVKSSVTLDVASQRWVERLTARNNPVKNCAFQALRIIGSGAGSAPLDLEWVHITTQYCQQKEGPYQLRNMNNILF
jgi:hypothetical protein